MEESVFLTFDEAREAVCIDFEQYGPQPDQLRRVMEILGAGHSLPEDEPMGGVARTLFALHRPGPDKLLDICTEVFWTRALPGSGPGGEPGLFVATDMERFECTRCGMCCRALDFHRECTAGDVRVWREAGRDDILEWVRPEADGTYRIWVRPGSELVAEVCPWLTQEPGNVWACSIHDLKPGVCKEYPGSRKHAYKTGCPTARPRCRVG